MFPRLGPWTGGVFMGLEGEGFRGLAQRPGFIVPHKASCHVGDFELGAGKVSATSLEHLMVPPGASGSVK